MTSAIATFVCHTDGKVTPDIWADPTATDPGSENARAIERLVRVCMKAKGVHREAIEAAVNAAEKEKAQ